MVNFGEEDFLLFCTVDEVLYAGNLIMKGCPESR